MLNSMLLVHENIGKASQHLREAIAQLAELKANTNLDFGKHEAFLAGRGVVLHYVEKKKIRGIVYSR